MNSSPQKHIAIKLMLVAALLSAAALAGAAQVAGTVVHLSGPLLARHADGSVKILALKSEVEEGDTLVTEKATYAQLKLIDNSEITLKPGTTFTIDKFSFESGKPENDSAAFSLVKGGLRSVTGLLGKRNHDRFALKTPAATIGIRGTIFIVDYTPPTALAMADLRKAYNAASTAALDAALLDVGSDAQAAPLVKPLKSLMLAQLALPPARSATTTASGLYVQVLDGMINVSNSGGAQNFAAGQFGYTPNISVPPVILPANPGIQFTPPPAFSVAPSAAGRGAVPAGTAVDCLVR